MAAENRRSHWEHVYEGRSPTEVSWYQQKPEASLRLGLHQHFTELLKQHGVEDPTHVQLNILWSLYVGVLGFWSTDKSPKQEDTLALLDQSVRMYVDWLSH